MSLIEQLIKMTAEREASLRRQIEMMATGKLQTGERRADTGWIDTTQKDLERAKGELAELVWMLARLREKAKDWR
jgi:hypothetical protein